MKSVLLIAICGLMTAGVFAQSRSITENEYNAVWRPATEKARTLNRRHVQRIEDYRDGKLFSTNEWQYEYVLPDRIHYVHIETYEGKTTRTEQINIGKSIYCKRDDGKWHVDFEMCIGGSFGGAGNGISKQTFSVEDVIVDGKPMKRYQRYYTSISIYPETPEKNAVLFSDSTFWLRDDGLITRQEIRTGKLNPEVVQDKTIETYEYEPKGLQIDAPR